MTKQTYDRSFKGRFEWKTTIDEMLIKKNRMSRNVDVAQTRRESGYVDVMTGKRLDGRVAAAG